MRAPVAIKWGLASVFIAGLLAGIARAVVVPDPGPMSNAPMGLMLIALGNADVAAACKKPMHVDRQTTVASTEPLTSVWSDQCADHGAQSAASLEGAAAFDSLTAIATGSYTNVRDSRTYVTSSGANVTVAFNDMLRFELTSAAPKSLQNSRCGITAPGAAEWLCIAVRVSLRAGFFAPSFDSTSAAFSTIFFGLGDPKFWGTNTLAVAWVCNGFDFCRGGQYSDNRTVNVFIGTNSVTNQPLTIPLTMRGQALVVTGSATDVVRPAVSNDLMAGFYGAKVCIDPVAGAAAVRVISQSGTDYSNAANHCY